MTAKRGLDMRPKDKHRRTASLREAQEEKKKVDIQITDEQKEMAIAVEAMRIARSATIPAHEKVERLVYKGA